MTKQQIDQYDMLLAVENHFDDNSRLWNSNIPLSNAKAQLSEKLDALAQEVAQQLINPSGITQAKAEVRERLEKKSFILAAALRGYASVQDKNDLYKRADISKTDFLRYREAELIGVVVNLISDARDVLAELNDYGINSDRLDDLEVLNQNFGNLMKDPDAAIAKRKKATDKIAELLPEALAILDARLDNLIVSLEDSQEEFVNIYGNLRQIQDTAVNPLALTITTLEADTNVPVAGVELEIVGENIRRTSSERGYNTVQNLPAGPHTISAKHPNYEPATLPFNIVSGETTELVVSLIRK